MNNKLVIAIALVAGLVGGILARYVVPPSAFAQNQAPVTKEVRAQSFTLVDSSNRAVGTFSFEPQPPPPPPNATGPTPQDSFQGPRRIVLRNSAGREIWSAGGSSIRQLSER
jgi:hypothetical protein